MARRKGKHRESSSNLQASSSGKGDFKSGRKPTPNIAQHKRKKISSEALIRKVGSSSRLPIPQSSSKRSSRLPQHSKIPHKKSMPGKKEEQGVIGPVEFRAPRIEGMSFLPKFMISISSLIAIALLFFFIIVFFIANNALDTEIKSGGAIYTNSISSFTKNYLLTVYDYNFLDSRLKTKDTSDELKQVFNIMKSNYLNGYDAFLTKLNEKKYNLDSDFVDGFNSLKFQNEDPVYYDLGKIQRDLALAAVYTYRLYNQEGLNTYLAADSSNLTNVPNQFRSDKIVIAFYLFCNTSHSNSNVATEAKKAFDFFMDKYEEVTSVIQVKYHEKVFENFFIPLTTQTNRIDGVFIGRESGLKSRTDEFVTKDFSPRKINSYPHSIDDVKISEPESGVRQFFTKFSIKNVDNDGEDIEYKVIVEYDNNELETSKNLLLNSLIILAVLAMIIGGIVSYFLGRTVTNPIMHLVETVKQIAQGNYKIRTQIRSRDEFWVLGKTIDMMCSNLDSAKELALVFSKYKHDIDITEEVVVQLLPESIPNIPNVDMHAYYNPAKEVGGDYYDFIKIDEDHVGIIVADVSGKGLPGAMVMTMARTILRYEAANSLSPKTVLSKANRHITRDIKRGMFVTAFYIVLNTKDMTLVAASAGHNPMYVLRYDDLEIEKINPNGIALGFDKGDIFEHTIREETIKLEDGDRIIIYTDGVVEAQTPDTEEPFGEQRLIDIIGNYPESDSKELTEIIEKAIIEHQGGSSEELQHDDITIVTLRYRNGNPQE